MGKKNKQSMSLLYGLSAGHGVKHFGQGALLVMIPSIKSTLGLSDVGVGGIYLLFNLYHQELRTFQQEY